MVIHRHLYMKSAITSGTTQYETLKTMDYVKKREPRRNILCKQTLSTAAAIEVPLT